MGGDVQEDETAIAEVKKQSEPAKQMLMEFYRKFDTNKDGQVTYGELQDGIKQSGLSMSYMVELDTNHDGIVSKGEWLNFFDVIPDDEIEDVRAFLEEGTIQEAEGGMEGSE